MALSQPGEFPWASNGSVGSSTTTINEVVASYITLENEKKILQRLGKDEDGKVGERERALIGPRTIHLQKCERGFGFTLRHFIVYPPPDANKLQKVDSDGTKIESGVGAMDTIFVKHVKEGSPAQRAGLNTGDRIISVNGESIAGKSYAQVIQLIQRSGNVLQLRVVPKEDDILQIYFPGTAYRSTPFDMTRASTTASSSVLPPSSLPIQPPKDGSVPLVLPSPSDLGRRRYSELPSLFQPTSLASASSQSGSTWSVSNAGLNYGTSGDRSRSSSDLSPASSSSSSSRPLLAYQSYLRPWPLKSNFNVLIQPCPPAPEYVTSSSGAIGHYVTNHSETGMTVNASAPSSVPSSREASIERPDVNDTIINRLRASFEKKEEFLLRTGPTVVNQRLFNVAAVSSSGGSTTGNDSAISSSSASSPTQVTTSTSGVGGGVPSSHFNFMATPVRTLMGIELEEPTSLPSVLKPPTLEGKSNSETLTRQSSANVRQLRKAASLDSGNHLPQASVPLKPVGNSSTGSAGSIVAVDPNGSQGLHMVSQRAKLFETGTLEQEANNRKKLYINELARMTTRGQTPRVSDRAAQFESLSTSQETIGSESDYSSSPRQKPNKGDVVGQMMRSAIGKMTASDVKSNSHPVVLRGSLAGNAAGSDEDRSAASTETDDEDDDSQRHRALRQDSYLAAVRAPYHDVRKHRTKHRHHHHHHHGRSKSSPGFTKQPEVASVTFSEILPATPVLFRVMSPDRQFQGGVPSNAVPPVALRRRVLYEDGENRAARRISYLKATAGDGGRVGGVNFRFGEEEENEETEEECTTPPSSSSSSRLTANSSETKNTTSGSSKVQSIQKLKSFFGEKTPQIVHAANEKGRLFRDFPAVSSLLLPNTSSSLIKEGWLHCKVATIDGKRATDRSWKQLWAILKGHTLHLYKDRKDAFQHQVSQSVEEHPIDLLRCRLETASDYTKKKHVFRIVTACGSEYLFQAENSTEMQRWIQAIQNAVDNNEMCVISQGIVQKKSAIFEREINHQQQNHGSVGVASSKGMKKLAPFRSRSPTGHSPTSKTRKSSHAAEDTSPKSKTWRGKMVKTIRKIHGTSPAADVAGGVTIGVSLDECPSSASNEFIPLLVELCTSIVEARGLEVIGIYRVPGNTAAVSYLLEAVNRGFDNLNLQDPRWSDVNVISSLLKAYFRKLPEPLVTCELYPAFIEASKSDDPDRRMYELKKMLHQLPDHNFETLKYLIRHLQKVVEHSNVNKMESRNLAIVFGPTLVRAADDNMVTMVKDMSFQCRIVESLINYGDWFFSSDENEDISNRYFGGREVMAANDASLPNANLLLLNNVIKMEHAQAEMRPKDVSAKDLVSSIIGAANRKVKQKMKRHAMVPEEIAVTKSNSVEERDIDREIELRLHRGGVSAATTNPTSETNGDAAPTEVKHRHDRRHSEDSTIFSLPIRAPPEDYSCPRKMSVDSLDGLSTTPRSSGEKERAFCVVRPTPSVKRTTWDGGSGNFGSTPQPPPYPPADVLKEGDGSEHSVLKTYAGLSASMQERIRKFELETKALLQRDSSATKRDQQLDRQRIEAEWQRAKLDLEQDDFLDRLADNPSTVPVTGINSAAVKADSTVLSSSSPKRPQPSVSQSPHHHLERRNDRAIPSPWPLNPHNRRSAASARSDMKRVSSVENFGERATTRVNAKGWASQRRKAISAEVPPGGEDILQYGGAAKWCGSLDSLREFYDASNSTGLHSSERNGGFGSSGKGNVSRSSENFPDQLYESSSRHKSDHRLQDKSSLEVIVGDRENAKALEKLERDDNETDISFQRNENTLITATLSTTANTISTTTTTAVMTATIKSTKPILGHRGSDPTSLNGSVVAFREKRCDNNNQKRLSSGGGVSKKGRGSPPPSSASQRKSSHLRSLKRRHTVGGTKDFEKFRLLVSGGGSGHGNQIEVEIPVNRIVNNSAWERLRPAVPTEQRSMKSWLRMERLRTSSPELQLPLSVDSAPESLMDVDDRKLVFENSSITEAKPETAALAMPPTLESQV